MYSGSTPLGGPSANRLPSRGVHHALEGGTYGPLLSRDGYATCKGEQDDEGGGQRLRLPPAERIGRAGGVLTTTTTNSSKGKSATHATTITGGGGGGLDNGISELRAATTGLLARHAAALDVPADAWFGGPMAATSARDAIPRTSPPAAWGGGLAGTTRSPSISTPTPPDATAGAEKQTHGSPSSSPPPVGGTSGGGVAAPNDRITAQTLSVLLRKTCKEVDALLPSVSGAATAPKKRSFTFAQSNRHGAGTKGGVPARLRVKGDTPHDFLRKTMDRDERAVPFPSHLTPPPPKPSRQAVETSIRYHEPPDITLALSAQYQQGSPDPASAQGLALPAAEGRATTMPSQQNSSTTGAGKRATGVVAHTREAPPSWSPPPPLTEEEAEAIIAGEHVAEEAEDGAPYRHSHRENGAAVSQSGSLQGGMKKGKKPITTVRQPVGFDANSGEGGLPTILTTLAFTATTRGDDASLVRELVRSHAAEHAAKAASSARFAGGGLRTTRGGGAASTLTVKALAAAAAGETASANTAGRTSPAPPPIAAPSSELPFSMLDAVLSVSKEYTSAAVSATAAATNAGVRTATPPIDVTELTAQRQRIVHRLCSLESSRVAESYWLTLQDPPLVTASSIAARQKTMNKSDPMPTSSTLYELLKGTGESNDAGVDVAGPFGAGPASSVSSPSLPLGAALTKPQARATATAAMVSSGSGEEAEKVTACDVACSMVMKSTLEPPPVPEAAEKGVLFPAPRPVGRAQVYLLAATLDAMLRDKGVSLLTALADPSIAHRVLPPEEAEDRKDAASCEVCAEEANPLLNASLTLTAEEAYATYTVAANEILRTLDVGLVELVRQVSCQCVERGALLDALRQTLVDVASSAFHVLQETKRRAYGEAHQRLLLRQELTRTEAALQHARTECAAAEKEKEALTKLNAALQVKADRFDQLMERVEAKRRRFETHTEDDHTSLLRELEEEIVTSAGDALCSLFDERHRQQFLTDDDDAAAAGQGEAVGEAPSAAVLRKAGAEQKRAMEDLYQQSYQLLAALDEATNAMNVASAPLYDKVVLKRVSPAARVAATRWATIARAVGAFEKDKSHRQKVFQTFVDWCGRFQTARSAAGGRSPGGAEKRSGKDGYSGGGPYLIGDDVATRAERDRADAEAEEAKQRNVRRQPEGVDAEKVLLGASAASFMSLPSSLLDLAPLSPEAVGEEEGKEDGKQHPGAAVNNTVAGTAAGSDEHETPATVAGAKTVVASIPFVTMDDLRSMGVDDCSPAEVNAMFARGFDFRGYLHPTWKPTASAPSGGAGLAPSPTSPSSEDAFGARAQGEGKTAFSSGGDGGELTLSLPDVAQMVRDVRQTLQELTLRLRAMAESEVLKRGAQPPLQAPARPEDACVLCGRRDNVREERKKRHAVMERIASEVQVHVNELTQRCQQAESDRETARTEVRRLQVELEEVLSKGIVMTSKPRAGGVASASGAADGAGRGAGGGDSASAAAAETAGGERKGSVHSPRMSPSSLMVTNRRGFSGVLASPTRSGHSPSHRTRRGSTNAAAAAAGGGGGKGLHPMGYTPSSPPKSIIKRRESSTYASPTKAAGSSAAAASSAALGDGTPLEDAMPVSSSPRSPRSSGGGVGGGDGNGGADGPRSSNDVRHSPLVHNVESILVQTSSLSSSSSLSSPTPALAVQPAASGQEEPREHDAAQNEGKGRGDIDSLAEDENKNNDDDDADDDDDDDDDIGGIAAVLLAKTGGRRRQSGFGPGAHKTGRTESPAAGAPSSSSYSVPVSSSSAPQPPPPQQQQQQQLPHHQHHHQHHHTPIPLEDSGTVSVSACGPGRSPMLPGNSISANFFDAMSRRDTMPMPATAVHSEASSLTAVDVAATLSPLTAVATGARETPLTLGSPDKRSAPNERVHVVVPSAQPSSSSLLPSAVDGEDDAADATGGG